METLKFVLGLDLDGCVADFVTEMRKIYAEWMGIPLLSLTATPTYGFPEWGLNNLEDYKRLHRYAVTQRELFLTMPPIAGAIPSLRRLSAEGIHIRIATHRLFISYFHEAAGSQTIRWLEKHGIPYWDLCLIKDKSAVDADLFVEDNPENIEALNRKKVPVVCMSNAMNEGLALPAVRVDSWDQAEVAIRAAYYSWRVERDLPLPEGPGLPPPGEVAPQPND